MPSRVFVSHHDDRLLGTRAGLRGRARRPQDYLQEFLQTSSGHASNAISRPSSPYSRASPRELTRKQLRGG